jgi:putative acetyltransferase
MNCEIRPFRQGDEPALFAIYQSAIRETASKDYTPEQIEAWAPPVLDPELWARRMQGIKPFVVESAGQIVAYADVQSTGYIDHFFVAGGCAMQGVGTLLMQHLLAQARQQSILELTSDVSRTAQPFYAKFGFVVVSHNNPVVRGVVVPNALMRLVLS